MWLGGNRDTRASPSPAAHRSAIGEIAGRAPVVTGRDFLLVIGERTRSVLVGSVIAVSPRSFVLTDSSSPRGRLRAMSHVQRALAYLRPRRLHLYGIGNGGSGTTSLTQMFGAYHATHENDFARLVPLTAGVLTGEIHANSARVRVALRRRSVRFHLDVDVASFLTPFAGTLASLYSDARFVLLIRDCFSWLDSRVEHVVRQPWSSRHPAWQAERARRHERYDDRFVSEEAVFATPGCARSPRTFGRGRTTTSEC